LDDTAIRTTDSPRFSRRSAVNLPHSTSVGMTCGLQYAGSATQQHKRLTNEQGKCKKCEIFSAWNIKANYMQFDITVISSHFYEVVLSPATRKKLIELLNKSKG
jgi:hypothetical protein